MEDSRKNKISNTRMYFAANLPRNPLMAQTNSESVFATQVSTPLLVLVLSSQNLVLVTHLVLLVHVASVGVLGGAGGGVQELRG